MLHLATWEIALHRSSVCCGRPLHLQLFMRAININDRAPTAQQTTVCAYMCGCVYECVCWQESSTVRQYNCSHLPMHAHTTVQRVKWGRKNISQNASQQMLAICHSNWERSLDGAWVWEATHSYRQKNSSYLMPLIKGKRSIDHHSNTKRRWNKLLYPVPVSCRMRCLHQLNIGRTCAGMQIDALRLE